jgi:hypothetical protein
MLIINKFPGKKKKKQQQKSWFFWQETNEATLPL